MKKKSDKTKDKNTLNYGSDHPFNTYDEPIKEEESENRDQSIKISKL